MSFYLALVLRPNPLAIFEPFDQFFSFRFLFHQETSFFKQITEFLFVFCQLNQQLLSFCLFELSMIFFLNLLFI
jgi:hypothetical protein